MTDYTAKLALDPVVFDMIHAHLSQHTMFDTTVIQPLSDTDTSVIFLWRAPFANHTYADLRVRNNHPTLGGPVIETVLYTLYGIELGYSALHYDLHPGDTFDMPFGRDTYSLTVERAQELDQ